jgi:drug/metabolite transporter (DMT)-like permease
MNEQDASLLIEDSPASPPFPPQNTPQHSQRFIIIGILVAVASHMFNGWCPALARYLQTVSHMPTLSINALSYVVVVILYLPRAIWLLIKYARTKPWTLVNMPENLTRTQKMWYLSKFSYTVVIMHNGQLILMAVVALIRSIISLLSTRFTQATNVQLIALLQPFCVTILSVIVYHMIRNPHSQLKKSLKHERLTKTVFIAVVVTIVGSVLVILGNASVQHDKNSSFQFLLSGISALYAAFTWWDLLGISLALLSTIGYSGYSILVKTATVSSEHNEYALKLTTENLFVVTLFIVGVFYWIISLAWGDDWTFLFSADWKTIVVFLVYALSSYFFANFFYILAIQMVGASDTSSFLAVSLIAAIGSAWIVLGEAINNLWQIIGSIIVLGSVTWLMTLKRAEVKRIQQEKPQEEQELQKQHIVEEELEEELKEVQEQL